MNISYYRNQAPPLPTYFVQRPDVSIKLKELLLADEETEKTRTLIISTIAQKVFHLLTVQGWKCPRGHVTKEQCTNYWCYSVGYCYKR
ncbi:MAG: hypothetical protein AB4058_19225 [Microcystaceae cyanobacterium]